MNTILERNDSKVTAEVLAVQPDRVLVKATWPNQDVPNILWLNNEYMAEKYSDALGLSKE